MKTKDILDFCVTAMAEHMNRGATVELFKATYPWPLDDFGNIVTSIQRIDQHTKTALLKRLDGAMMDSLQFPETTGEALMCRLRLENAICMLTILSKAKIPCEVLTTLEEEAFLWAVTALWTGSGVQWACRTAQAFLEGKPSALPWPLQA